MLNNCCNEKCSLHEGCKRFVLEEDADIYASFVDFQPSIDKEDGYTTCMAYLPGKYEKPKKKYCDSEGCNTCQESNCGKCNDGLVF